jgi:hypothetical protein
LSRVAVEPEIDAEPGDQNRSLTIAAVILSSCALVFFAWQLLSTGATSPDLLYFWGVKGTKFALAGGIDAELLGWRFFAHAHGNYPPLLTTWYAWAVLVAGDMPWRWVPFTSWIWVAATSAVLSVLLRLRLRAPAAVAVTSVWTVIITASCAYSNSGGNAEAPLVAYLTIACAALLVTSSAGPSFTWPAVTLGFTGAVLTKTEVAISVLLLAGGSLLQSWLERDRFSRVRVAQAIIVAAAAVGLWYLFLAVHHLPLSDPVRPHVLDVRFDFVRQILSAFPFGLNAGTATLSWWILVLALLRSRRPIVPFLPAAVLCGGLLMFTFLYYLHSGSDPTTLVKWTLPRLSQPALSALAIWAGLAWCDRHHTTRPFTS